VQSNTYANWAQSYVKIKMEFCVYRPVSCFFCYLITLTGQELRQNRYLLPAPEAAGHELLNLGLGVNCSTTSAERIAKQLNYSRQSWTDSLHPKRALSCTFFWGGGFKGRLRALFETAIALSIAVFIDKI
jgi:hypothetical protein